MSVKPWGGNLPEVCPELDNTEPQKTDKKFGIAPKNSGRLATLIVIRFRTNRTNRPIDHCIQFRDLIEHLARVIRAPEITKMNEYER